MNWKTSFENITAHPGSSGTNTVAKLLELGLNYLGLGIGLVSSVHEDVYRVEHASSPGDMIEPGTIFPIGHTYCWHTLKANKPLGFHHAGDSSIATHPCYSHFKLESYIGAPIIVGDKAVGTVNFSAAAPRDPFCAADFEFVTTLSRYLAQSYFREVDVH